MEHLQQTVNNKGAIQPLLSSELTAHSIPLIHPDDLARSLNVSRGVVGGWVDSNYLPTIKVGRYNYINLALLNADCLAGQLKEQY